jgi:hypothetical protein
LKLWQCRFLRHQSLKQKHSIHKQPEQQQTHTDDPETVRSFGLRRLPRRGEMPSRLSLLCDTAGDGNDGTSLVAVAVVVVVVADVVDVVVVVVDVVVAAEVGVDACCCARGERSGAASSGASACVCCWCCCGGGVESACDCDLSFDVVFLPPNRPKRRFSFGVDVSLFGVNLQV